MKKVIALFLLIILVVLLMTFIGSINDCPDTPQKIVFDSGSTDWNGNQELDSVKKESSGYITIPGLFEMVLKEGVTKQRVNIYNPEANQCYMIFNLICNGDVIWCSGYCKPGTGFYCIELNYPLISGKYKGSILYECYSPEGEQLNSANIAFPIYVQ